MNTRFSPVVFIILFLMFTCGTVSAGDEQSINQGLQANAGGVYNLRPQTYTISSQIVIPDNTELRGDGGTVFKIVDECKWDQNVPMIALNNQKNITIKGIIFEGNQDKQTYVPAKTGNKRWGQQYNTFIYAQHTDGITVVNCSFNDNLGDGLRVSNCKNIEFAYNTGSMGGHDAFLL
jgi:hypothetical protein